MKTWQTVQSMCFAGILSSILYLAYCFCVFSYSKSIISIMHSAYISAEAQKEVTEQVLVFMEVSRNKNSIYSLLRKNFPAIVSMTYNSFRPGYLKIHLSYDVPLMIIKENYESPIVLTKQGHYAPFSYYQEDILESLPILTVTKKGELTQSQAMVYSWINSLPNDFHQRYYAFWESAHTILIHDTHHTDFIYIITAQTNLELLNSNNIKRMQQIIYKKQGNKKYKKWHIDLRFQDHYIAQGIV